MTMQVTRISKIKNHRLFKDFQWPAGLHDFGRFNLMLGWNASGKTTLSNLFRAMEKRQAVSEGEVEFTIDGREVTGTVLASGIPLPQVRVFNRDFVAASVFVSTSAPISPIFFLGEESVTKQKQAEVLKGQLSDVFDKTEGAQAALKAAMESLDNFCIQRGTVIRELLRSSGSNTYNNYDKRTFRGACDDLTKGDPASKRLSDDEKSALMRQKDATPKRKLDPITTKFADVPGLAAKVETLLGQTVLSQTMDELLMDDGVAEWVMQGIQYHKGADSASCRFCGQRMPSERLARLEGHFNDHYARFLAEIADTLTNVQSCKTAIIPVAPPSTALYDDLAGDYSAAVDALNIYGRDVIAYLTVLEGALTKKQTKPFERMSLETAKAASLPDGNVGTQRLEAANATIGMHNSRTDDFTQVVVSARRKLEECLVAEELDTFNDRNKTIKDAEAALTQLRQTEQQISGKITDLEKDIVEHRRPADQLNRELGSYLGQSELAFEVKENGYTITRHGKPADGLSEGERTAISLLYFLKSLQDKTFNLSEGIVVVDDPVSSLDATALFCAFGYMRERTKEAGQLFVLTHNASFFSQVKNWFSHLNKRHRKGQPEPAHFYMVSTSLDETGRVATIADLDPLLHQYESDYHYLFKRVLDESEQSQGGNSLEAFYGLPNIARRLLETFLAFRYPRPTNGLREQMNLVSFDEAKKSRILRFLNTYSHTPKISDPEHDPSILAETPQVLKDVLELIRSEDPRHFEQMAEVTVKGKKD